MSRGSDLEADVIKLARMLRWKVAHWRSVPVKYNNRTVYQTPVQADGAGWPDMVCVRERIVFIECKSGSGRLSPEQKAWKALLESTGAEYYVVGDDDLQDLAARLR